MGNLPEGIQNQLYKNLHEINFNKTLRLIKRIKTEGDEYDIIQLAMNNDFEPIERDIDTYTDTDTIDTDTLEEIVEDLDTSLNPIASESLEQMEYYFVDAHNLTLDMSIHEQMQIVSKDKHIWIDLRCDVDYFFDEHFSIYQCENTAMMSGRSYKKDKYHNR